MRPVCGLVGPGRVRETHGGPRSGPPCGSTCRMDAGVPGLPLASVSPLTKSFVFDKRCRLAGLVAPFREDWLEPGSRAVAFLVAEAKPLSLLSLSFSPRLLRERC